MLCFPFIRAIQASLELYQQNLGLNDLESDALNYNLHMALSMSEQQQKQEQQLQEEEQKMLEEILRLSLTEKWDFSKLLYFFLLLYDCQLFGRRQIVFERLGFGFVSIFSSNLRKSLMKQLMFLYIYNTKFSIQRIKKSHF